MNHGKYALFSYTTGNVGDDIQSVAGSRFLSQVDYYINRDYMQEFQVADEEPIKLIMNGKKLFLLGHLLGVLDC